MDLALLQDADPVTRRRLLMEAEEDQWFDRKSARVQPRDLAPVLVAFANAEGGVIAVGIEDGRVVGTTPDAENRIRQAPLDFTRPAVPCQAQRLRCRSDAGDDVDVLLLVIASSDEVHATVRDEVFLRVGDETRRLSFKQRQQLEFDKGQSAYEATPARRLTRSELDEDLLADVARRLGASDADRMLAARGLVDRDGVVTVGAALLFGRQPQAELPQAHVRVIRYRGRERGAGRRQQIVSDERVEGPLPRQIERAAALISASVPRRRALGRDGVFVDVGAVPRDAWMEGLVNAVAHRSYSVAGDHIRVEVFDDRLELSSPGRFPGIVDLSRPEELPRFARNPRIARVLADLDFGQELGEGIRRMFEEMRLAGLAAPVYRQTAGSVVLTLLFEPVDRELEERLSAEGRLLVRTIREAGRMSTGELVRVAGRSRPSVLRDLQVLRDAGIVEWVGKSRKDPRAYWRIRSSDVPHRQ